MVVPGVAATSPNGAPGNEEKVELPLCTSFPVGIPESDRPADGDTVSFKVGASKMAPSSPNRTEHIIVPRLQPVLG